MNRLLPPAAGLLLLPMAAAAQEPRTAPPVFPVGLDVVNVTVTVRDAKGRLVTDLAAEDFVVLEDGRPQGLRLFARSVEPGQEEALTLDLGLLMDTSESMLKELRLSQEAALRFLETVPRAHELLTIFFDQDLRISRYDSEQQQGLFERILSTRSGGMTALYDAITVYLSRVQDSPGRKVLVVFTDGEDSTSAVSFPELARMLRSSAVTVYPIAFMGGFTPGSPRALTSQAVLHQIADLTGGQVFRPSASRDLPKIYGKILDELASQYVLGFVSESAARDGRFRKLKVEVKRPGLKARHRPGYYAFASP